MSDAIEAAVDAFRHSTFNALTRDECRDAVRAALTAYEAAKGGDVGVRDIIQHALGRLAIFREMLPEEDEPWESWYAAAFDMVSVEIDTILSALTSPASGERDAPAGYVLVPVEPTEAMHQAAWLACDNDMKPGADWPSFNAKIYRAMLAAALRMEGK